MEVLDRCELFCRRVREAVGSKADLLFGTHGQMVPSSAIRLAEASWKYDPLWFEEPVPPGQEEAMATIAQHTSIPIATGERPDHSLQIPPEAAASAGGASILQLNVARVGGLLNQEDRHAGGDALRTDCAAPVQRPSGRRCEHIQLAACTPNFLIQESIMTWGGFHAEVVKTPIRWEDGYIIPSNEPGLGIELNMDVVRAFAVHRPAPASADGRKPVVKDLAPAKG